MRESSASMNRDWGPRYSSYYNGGGGPSSYPMEASRATTASCDSDAVSISNASEVEGEWIEEDEPGVYITIRQLVDGTRELRRVRFRCELKLHLYQFFKLHFLDLVKSNLENLLEIFIVENDLGRCMLSNGGTLIGIGYKLNIFLRR